MKNWALSLITTGILILVACNKKTAKMDPVEVKPQVIDSVELVEILPVVTEKQIAQTKMGKTENPVKAEVSIQDEAKPMHELELKEAPREKKPDSKKEGRHQHHPKGKMASPTRSMDALSGAPMSLGSGGYDQSAMAQPIPHNTESYDHISENGFRNPVTAPLSTFSIDVDVASYANMRRFLNNNQLPPEDAVRIEEFLNYFNYSYSQPKSEDPFSINTEVSDCPWKSKHKLVHIGLQGKKVDAKSLPSSNLVFLLDVSGSMNSPEKLPLLKKAFAMLVEQLGEKDRVAITVYAGAAGLVLPSTKGSDKARILATLENLAAGGSTAGGAGIQLAYKTAQENFIKGGNNRVILATDGDFNIGASSDGEMVRLIEEKKKSGVFLTVLGFGTGNYKDSKMEKLADKGNGNYAYIDNLLEAKKVLVSEMGGTLVTIAKDVKIQVEFNPATVQAYRLVGYENRLLNAEDFNDDKKDAGELGSGHTVTALYEIVPHGVKMEAPSTEELKYQKPKGFEGHGAELLTVKFRYKAPDGEKSKLISHTVENKSIKFSSSSENFRFSSAVAGFGMLLRNSEHKGEIKMSEVMDLARNAKGKDENGYRAEFIKLVELAQILKAGNNP